MKHFSMERIGTYAVVTIAAFALLLFANQRLALADISIPPDTATPSAPAEAVSAPIEAPSASVGTPTYEPVFIPSSPTIDKGGGVELYSGPSAPVYSTYTNTSGSVTETDGQTYTMTGSLEQIYQDIQEIVADHAAAGLSVTVVYNSAGIPTGLICENTATGIFVVSGPTGGPTSGGGGGGGGSIPTGFGDPVPSGYGGMDGPLPLEYGGHLPLEFGGPGGGDTSGGGSGCGADTGELKANPTRVPQGGKTTFSWEGVQAASTCSIMDGNTLVADLPYKGTACNYGNTDASTGILSGPITKRTTFALVCGPTTVDTVTVDLLPTYQEF